MALHRSTGLGRRRLPPAPIFSGAGPSNPCIRIEGASRSGRDPKRRLTPQRPSSFDARGRGKTKIQQSGTPVRSRLGYPGSACAGPLRPLSFGTPPPPAKECGRTRASTSKPRSWPPTLPLRRFSGFSSAASFASLSSRRRPRAPSRRASSALGSSTTPAVAGLCSRRLRRTP